VALNLLIVDDDALVRAGLRAVLGSEPDFEVIGEAGNGKEAIERAAELSPDLVLMDIRMPEMDGLEATRTIVEDGGPRVLILTTFELDEYVYEAMRVGASGFMLKRSSPEDLVTAVRIAASGDSLVLPEAMRRMVEQYAESGAQSAQIRKDIGRLTSREQDVLKHVAQGLSNVEIADELFVSRETVKSHVTSILMKLDVRDRTQAVIAAYESGFVQAGPG
jgi:DNA-binding NarL/FixJ family response regulator